MNLTRLSWFGTLGAVGILVAGLLGCAGDTTGVPAPADPSHAYWSLNLNQKAIVLALGDTIRLTAVPRNALGDPLSGLAPVTYTASDSNITVDQMGLVTAHYVTDNQLKRVVATLQSRGVTHTDTAFIIVVPVTPDPSLDSISMQPMAGDSARRPLDSFTGGSFDWSARLFYTDCDPNITSCPRAVYYSSSNPSIATIDPHTGQVTPVDTGHVILTAQTVVNRKVWRDSVNFRIGANLRAIVFPGDGQQQYVLGVGAVVNFVNFTRSFQRIYRPWQVTFTPFVGVDSAADWQFQFPQTGGGDITFDCDSLANPGCFFPNQIVAARRFPIPGTYEVRLSLVPAAKYELVIVP